MLIHILAVLAALVGSFVVGFVWYGPLFGKKWSKYTGIKENDKEMKANMWKYIAKTQCFDLLSVILLSLIIKFAGYSGILDVIVFIFLSWIVFSVPAVMGPSIWEKRPFGLGMINIFANLATLMTAGIILMIIL